MAYEKQKFKDGQPLRAEHLNKMEDAIAEALNGAGGGGGLPEGGEPYKQLVTDASGKTVWEDRLAYKMAGKGVLIADLGTLEFTESATAGWYTKYKSVSGFEDYEKLVVVWDGVEYVCAGGNFYIGNWAHYNPDGEDTGEPFLYHPGEFGWGTTQPGSHSIAVYAYGETIKPIDPDLIGGWKALGEKTENITLTFDGNTDGMETVEVSDSFTLVKISDDIPAKENMIGAVLTDTVGSFTIAENDIIDQGSGSYAVTELMLVVSDYTADSTVAVTSNGIWFAKAGEMYISKFEYTDTEYMPIPDEYMPDSVKTFFEIDYDWETNTLNTTNDDIRKALKEKRDFRIKIAGMPGYCASSFLEEDGSFNLKLFSFDISNMVFYIVYIDSEIEPERILFGVTGEWVSPGER